MDKNKKEATARKRKACVLCLTPLMNGEGHNPEPVRDFADGLACRECNVTTVLAARIRRVDAVAKASKSTGFRANNRRKAC